MGRSIAELLARSGQLTASDSARRDLEVLLCAVIGRPRTFLFSHPETELDSEQLARFDAWFERRQKGEPVAYITGQREFWSLELEVSPATLIPRPDTERLVECALECFPEKSVGNGLDLGTGTGAIALALASELPAWPWVGVDAQQQAVELAERNAQRLNLENCRFLVSDWFEALSGCRFDLIVSNPPYIETDDAHLQQGDVRFEPKSALVSGSDGLRDISLIVHSAPDYLNSGGWLLLEHGYDQAVSVRELLQKRGFSQVATERDYGGNERVTLGHWVG